jgi:hypothetical protein
MAEDEAHPTADPAPLPRHERAWRHPSEIGQQRRAVLRRSAPPLSPLIASLCGALGVALVVALVALIVPPGTRRESPAQVRNAAVDAPDRADDTHTLPGLMTVDGRRFVLAITDPSRANPLFVTTGAVSRVDVDVDGRRVPLTVVSRADGLTLLTGGAVAPRSTRIGSPPITPPTTGTKVVVSGHSTTAAVIGISVNTDARSFVPLAGDVLRTDVTESSVVEDGAGHILGLYTERDGARGYVPISVIEDQLLRP